MIKQTILLLSFCGVIQGCVTVPPVYVYSKSYVGSKWHLPPSKARKASISSGQSKRLQSQKNQNLKVSIDTSSLINNADQIQKNKSRYMLGAVVYHLKKNYLFQNIELKPKAEKSADYNIFVNLTWYDDMFSLTNTNETTALKKENKSCFQFKFTIENPKDENDVYNFLSNGCPGITDERLIISKLMTTMFRELWLIDAAYTFRLPLKGSSAKSSFSDFKTDPDVDKFLGFTKVR